MSVKMFWGLIFWLVICLLWSSELRCQTLSPTDEYDRLLKAGSEVAALGEGLAGEQVRLYSGRLTLSQSDLTMAGNSGLPVSIGRRFVPGTRGDSGLGYFGDWDLEVPAIHGVFSHRDGWIIPAPVGSVDRFKRCTYFNEPPTAVGQVDGYFSANEFWQGTSVYLPGSGDQEILTKNPAMRVPSDGKSYPLILADGSVLTCLATLDPGSEQTNGEGFELATLDGMRYRFDHLVIRTHAALTKSSPDPALVGDQSAGRRGSNPTPNVYNGYLLYRDEYWMYPTSVTDRFGNKVVYSWNASNPKQLLSISANDGRSVSFTYVDTTGYQIKSVSTNGTPARSVNYEYNTDTLTGVLLPDNSRWGFALNSVAGTRPRPSAPMSCDIPGGVSTSPIVGTVTHPSGAVITFTFANRLMPRTWVPRECYGLGMSGSYDDYAYFIKDSYSTSLISKKITGPGIPAAGYVWSYAYDNVQGCWNPTNLPANAPACSASTTGKRTVTVTNPDQTVDRFVYGNHFQVDEGKLLSKQTNVSGTSALQTETFVYALPNAGPYPSTIGGSRQTRGDSYMTERFMPLTQKTFSRNGTTFQSTVETFDASARPVRVKKSTSIP